MYMIVSQAYICEKNDIKHVKHVKLQDVFLKNRCPIDFLKFIFSFLEFLPIFKYFTD